MKVKPHTASISEAALFTRTTQPQSNDSISQAFSRSLNLDVSGGLIVCLDVFQQAGASTGGNHPDIFHLTDKGRQAYQYLTGMPPLENEIVLDPKTGEMVFIEVERDTRKVRHVRTRKWRKVMNATNGQIYVICDNIQCERKILTEVNQALEGLPFNSRLTNLNSLNKGKRGNKRMNDPVVRPDCSRRVLRTNTVVK